MLKGASGSARERTLRICDCGKKLPARSAEASTLARCFPSVKRAPRCAHEAWSPRSCCMTGTCPSNPRQTGRSGSCAVGPSAGRSSRATAGRVTARENHDTAGRAARAARFGPSRGTPFQRQPPPAGPARPPPARAAGAYASCAGSWTDAMSASSAASVGHPAARKQPTMIRQGAASSRPIDASRWSSRPEADVPLRQS